MSVWSLVDQMNCWHCNNRERTRDTSASSKFTYSKGPTKAGKKCAGRRRGRNRRLRTTSNTGPSGRGESATKTSSSSGRGAKHPTDTLSTWRARKTEEVNSGRAATSRRPEAPHCWKTQAPTLPANMTGSTREGTQGFRRGIDRSINLDRSKGMTRDPRTIDNFNKPFRLDQCQKPRTKKGHNLWRDGTEKSQWEAWWPKRHRDGGYQQETKTGAKTEDQKQDQSLLEMDHVGDLPTQPKLTLERENWRRYRSWRPREKPQQPNNLAHLRRLKPINFLRVQSRTDRARNSTQNPHSRRNFWRSKHPQRP